VQVRKVTDRHRGFSKLVRFRLSWETDHFAVMSGADDEDKLDAGLHQEVVRLVRAAADRDLDEQGLLFTLKKIAKRATEDIAEEGSVLAAEDIAP
jgi:hypothetical protein